jgi:hypothetical protein
MKTGVQLIADERKRQIENEGYDATHDSQYKNSVLGNAGICYAVMAGGSPEIRNAVREQASAGHAPKGWPWGLEFWRPSAGDSDAERIKELVKAGALLAAEIDRLNRKIN